MYIMFYSEFNPGEIMKVDLHKMKVWEATIYLNNVVSRAPKDVREIIVIHGYHSGTALLDMVRNDFANKRVKMKLKGLNQGVTSLILN